MLRPQIREKKEDSLVREKNGEGNKGFNLFKTAVVSADFKLCATVQMERWRRTMACSYIRHINWVGWLLCLLSPDPANVKFIPEIRHLLGAQRLFNLEIPVLLRSLKLSNVELGQYLDGRLFKCCLSVAANP